MNIQETFDYLSSSEIATAHNTGNAKNPRVEVILKSGEKVIVERDFLNHYSIFLQVDKSTPTHWGVKEKEKK